MPDAPPPLRALDPDEARAVARHPLPPGVPDALVNKAQLEVALGVSQVTITAWLRKGLPFEVEGANGRSYQFRLSLAYAWNCDRLALDRSRDAAAEDAARQMRLALVGDDGLGQAGGLSLREQREILELQHVHAIAARDRGDLMRRADVVDALEVVFAAVVAALDALPDRLVREFALDGAQVERAEAICDDVQAAAHRGIVEILGDAHGDKDRAGG